MQRLANRQPEKPKGPEVFDLWSMPTKAEQWKAEKEDAQLGGFHIRKTAKPMPVHTPRSMHQKASCAPAVLPAHEGQSVNPQSEAYEDLACMAAAKELEKEEEAKVLERTRRPITAELKDALGDEAVDAMDDVTRIATYRKMFCSHEAPEQQEGESEEAYERRVAKFKRKSQSQKNKERKRKFTDHRQAQLKAQQRLEKSVGEVGAILRDLKEEERLREERRAYRLAMRQERKTLEATGGVMDPTTRLGRGKAPTEDLTVPDEERAGSLRQVPMKASAVKDRLSSILRRGLLPARADSALEGASRKKKSLRWRHKKRIVSPLKRDNMVIR